MTATAATRGLVNDRRVMPLRVDCSRALRLGLGGQRHRSEQKRSCEQRDCELAHMGLRLLSIKEYDCTATVIFTSARLSRR